VETTDLVVELGAGTGRLTVPLAQQAGEVRAIELDPRLVERLRRRFHAQPTISVVEGDVLRVHLPHEEFRVVANIPFGRTGAIFRRLFDDPRIPLARADLIVEWGVAVKRTTCWPSTMLNVTRGAVYEFVLVRRLPARCFEPAPHVDAALLSVRRRPAPLVPEADYEAFRSFVAAGFSSGVRRAAEARMPRRRFGEAARELGFATTAQARTLDLHQWAGLHRAVSRMR